MINYVSLHNHTSYSLMRGLSKPLDLFKRAKELGQTAVAVTDYATMAGMWDSYKAYKKTGVKLIAGCEFNFVDDTNDQSAGFRTIVLLAKNFTGYQNILTLHKKAFDHANYSFKKPQPRIDWNLLKDHSEGVICISGDGNGVISQLLMKKNFEEAEKQTKKLVDIFGDYFALELQPHALNRKASTYSGQIDQSFINKNLKIIGEKLNIKCIAATDSHYLYKDHHDAHDVLLAIGSGQPKKSGNRLKFNNEFYVKSAVEVAHYFVRYRSIYSPKFIESLFDNTIYFSDMCEEPLWINLSYSNKGKKELPAFPVKNQKDYENFLNWAKDKEGLPEDVLYLRYRCELGLKKLTPPGKETEYRDRLNEELEVLEYHGFSSYMLIVADYLDWAKSNGIRVGYGRGSVGGCIVAYFLDIHKADPIRNNLIFARFLNKHKTEYPDIDCDISTSGRDKVKKYIKQKYGEDYVAAISNVNTISPKVYVRDISRVFEFGDKGRTESAEIGNNIADSISAEVKNVSQALEKYPLFAEYAEKYPPLKDYAELIGGVSRAWSTHAGGLVIGRRPLVGLVPLRRDEDGELVLEYDKNTAEEIGLVKMDVLAVSALDTISDTYKIIESVGKPPPPDPPNFYEYDEKTFNLISAGDTFGVFQLSDSAIFLCKAVQPKHIMDISYINSLVRPSAKDFRDDFIKARHSGEKVELMHSYLERAFGNTYGFGLFEECLMFLAQDVAGWDMHSADRLRKLTKEKGKNPKKVAQWRDEFIQDAIKNKGLDEEIATKIWDQVVDAFQGYGFNASHSLFYSFLAFHTAYLKAYYPLEFLVAVLMFESRSNSPKAADNVLKAKEEIRRLGVKIVPPDINKSGMTYQIINENTLMTGFDSMKYMGKDAIPEILEKRPFNSFEDFLRKVDNKKVRSTAIQAMAACGCLDSFGLPRKTMFLYASDYKKKLSVHVKRTEEPFNYPFPDEIDWCAKDKFALELKYLGEGISGTVNERYDQFFSRSATNFEGLKKKYPYSKKSDDLRQDRKMNSHPVSPLKGIIIHIFSFVVKKEDSPILGQEMARITLEDFYGNTISALAFPETWEHVQRYIKEQTNNKHTFSVGLAVAFSGIYQHENAHTSSFIIGDIEEFQPPPDIPKDLKPRKVKLPRAKKIKKDILKEDKEKIIEELEDSLTWDD